MPIVESASPGWWGDGIALLPAATQVIRNNDVEHPFRQDSAFYYLTGFDEPDAIMLIDPAAADEQYVLFVRPRDREREIWERPAGRYRGRQGALRRRGLVPRVRLRRDLAAQARGSLGGLPAVR